jgi:hypothetical protein
MSIVIAIVFALSIVVVTIDVIRRIPKRRRRDRDEDQFITTQKIIVDLNRR